MAQVLFLEHFYHFPSTSKLCRNPSAERYELPFNQPLPSLFPDTAEIGQNSEFEQKTL